MVHKLDKRLMHNENEVMHNENGQQNARFETSECASKE